jgi:hypothetical protein
VRLCDTIVQSAAVSAPLPLRGSAMQPARPLQLRFAWSRLSVPWSSALVASQGGGASIHSANGPRLVLVVCPRSMLWPCGRRCNVVRDPVQLSNAALATWFSTTSELHGGELAREARTETEKVAIIAICATRTCTARRAT